MKEYWKTYFENKPILKYGVDQQNSIGNVFPL